MSLKKSNLKALILAGILSAGIFVQQAGYLDAARELDRIETFAQAWWAAPAAVTLQAVLYMIAFPGSLLIWSLGAIYRPWAATSLVVAGGAAGGVAAYYLSAGLSSAWAERFTHTGAYKLLERNSAFLQLFALRCLPGFPHAFINYSCGILKVRLGNFVVSTILGFTVKGYIYCSAIYHALHIEDAGDAVSFSTVRPLLFLVLFSLAGIFIKNKYFE